MSFLWAWFLIDFIWYLDSYSQIIACRKIAVHLNSFSKLSSLGNGSSVFFFFCIWKDVEIFSFLILPKVHLSVVSMGGAWSKIFTRFWVAVSGVKGWWWIRINKVGLRVQPGKFVLREVFELRKLIFVLSAIIASQWDTFSKMPYKKTKSFLVSYCTIIYVLYLEYPTIKSYILVVVILGYVFEANFVP